MTEPDSNARTTLTICSHCGGQKALFYEIEPTYSNGFTSGGMLSVSSSSMRLCTCLSIEQEWHDGKLDKREGSCYYAMVEYTSLHSVSHLVDKTICIESGYGDLYSNMIYLDPQQALSLLAWLKQEQPTLERLVQEQEAKHEQL